MDSINGRELSHDLSHWNYGNRIILERRTLSVTLLSGEELIVQRVPRTCLVADVIDKLQELRPLENGQAYKLVCNHCTYQASDPLPQVETFCATVVDELHELVEKLRASPAGQHMTERGMRKAALMSWRREWAKKDDLLVRTRQKLLGSERVHINVASHEGHSQIETSEGKWCVSCHCPLNAERMARYIFGNLILAPQRIVVVLESGEDLAIEFCMWHCLVADLVDRLSLMRPLDRLGQVYHLNCGGIELVPHEMLPTNGTIFAIVVDELQPFVDKLKDFPAGHVSTLKL